LPDNRIEAGTSSVWLVYCRNDEPSVDDVMAHLGTHATDWSVVESEVGYVQPENKQMPPLYCRWVHIARR
jgi:hypothetical protein